MFTTSYILKITSQHCCRSCRSMQNWALVEINHNWKYRCLFTSKEVLVMIETLFSSKREFTISSVNQIPNSGAEQVACDVAGLDSFKVWQRKGGRMTHPWNSFSYECLLALEKHLKPATVLPPGYGI